MDLSFLPSLPFTLSYPLLFGGLLVAGMLGGEVARIVHAPRVLGYVVVGFLIGPFVRVLGLRPLLDEGRIFVDLALGLVLFDLGRRMDLQWMRRDWTLAAAGIAESLFSFGAVLVAFLAFHFDPVESALAAAVVMSAAPEVLLMVVHDTSSEGQVTERAMNMVALNSLFASILATILLGSAHYEARTPIEVAILHPLYLFFGSLLLGALMAWITRGIARTVEKTREVHFALVAGMVVCAVGLAAMLKLPVILALLAFGLFARNDERSYDLLNVNLAPAGRLLYIVLFVITGASLPLTAVVGGGLVALAVVAARAAGKIAAVAGVAPIGGLTVRQAIGLAGSVMPMSSLALLLEHDIARIFPAFGEEFGGVILSAILIMQIAGPLALQWGLRFAGEALPDPSTTARLQARAYNVTGS